MADPTDPRLAGLFQLTQEPVFILNHQRRVLFTNPALAALLGQEADELRGLVCRRHRDAEPGSRQAWAGVLAPPAEVLEGQPARCRRLVPDASLVRRWWDIDFLPLRGAAGVAVIIGRVLPLDPPPPPTLAKLSENLADLRQTSVRRQRLDLLPASSPNMARIVNQARLACQTNVPVLICGQPGTGKEWLARTIQAQGLAPEGTFLALDSRRLPPAAVADAVFGPAPWLRRVGAIYFREPQCLPRDLQLRIADRLAESAPGPRILAGCSADPTEEVHAGRLLDQLHMALSTLVITLPPLCERLEDLSLLVERFLERGGRKELRLSPAVWDLLRRYSWPGNLDELRQALANADRRAGGQPIEPAHLPTHIRQAVALDEVAPRPPDHRLPLDSILEQVERRLIQLALRMGQGSKTRAAELLAIWRARLLRRMESLGIADPEPGSLEKAEAGKKEEKEEGA